MENIDNLQNPESADHIADESNHNSTSYTLHSQFINLLQTYWGYEDFRGIQREIIESIASGHDTLGLMPTGGGKSITFQVPALAMHGVCIVITPLIALMKDQVTHLRHIGIQAAAIYSSMSREEIIGNVNANMKTIRYELGTRIRNQVRVIPELRFFIDDSLDYIDRIDELLKK